jgi:hypothetical protein
MGISAPKPPLLRDSPPRRFRRTGPLVLALVVQAVLLLVTVFVIVAIPPNRAEPEFTARPSIYLPQRELEHRVALAEFQQAVSKPLPMERLTTSALLPQGLPPMPTVPTSDFTSMETATLIPADTAALLGQQGLPGANRPNTGQSASSFFGIEDTGQRIIIMVNTSASVVHKADRRGVTIDRIQQEMIDLVEGLDPNVLFGIIQFSQGVRSFETFLAPATRANKEAVKQWVPTNLRGNPRAQTNQNHYGHEAAFEAAFAMSPDVIFLLTDAQLNRREGSPGNYSYPEIPYAQLMRTVRSFQQQAGTPARIHVVAFEMKPSDAEGMRHLTREFKGQLREF